MQMIVSSIDAQPPSITRPGTIVVLTPLDAIAQLEGRVIATIVLAGSYATDHALAAFLAESYPMVQIEQEA
jgi:hypothetical protein